MNKIKMLLLAVVIALAGCHSDSKTADLKNMYYPVQEGGITVYYVDYYYDCIDGYFYFIYDADPNPLYDVNNEIIVCTGLFEYTNDEALFIVSSGLIRAPTEDQLSF